MHSFLHDVRYALRTFGRSPGFTAVAVLTLALGIGANTAVFSVVRAVLLEELPYRDASRLVMVWEEATHIGFPENTPAPANYADWKAQSTVFAGMAALQSRSFNLTGGGRPERLAGRRVTHDLFAVLGVEPLIGRTFTADDDRPEASHVAIVSHALWQTRFGGSNSLLGDTILLDGTPHTVIGVMPPGFDFPEQGTQVWTPIAFTPEQLANRGSHYLRVVARLRSGVTLDEARTEMTTIASRLAQDHPETNTNLGVRLNPLRDQLVGNTRVGLMLLMTMAGCVLLIAAANLANLLLSRATERRREFAVRLAIGAGRARLLRQLFCENLVLAATGALLGVLLAAWSFEFLASLIPPDLTSAQLTLDTQLLAFTVVLCLVTTLLFGAFPAELAWRLGTAESLKQTQGRSGEHQSTRRVRAGLIISQMAFAVCLLAGAGLIVRTFVSLRAIDPGFRGEDVLTLRTALPLPQYADLTRRTAFYREVLDRVTTLPGVTAAGFTSWLPYTNWGGTTGFVIEGRPAPGPGEINDANIRLVTAGYFPAMGMRLLRGRVLTEADREDTEPVAVINETMARQYWGAADPLNSRFRSCSECPWLRIVGVVGDIHQRALDADVRPEYYAPYWQLAELAVWAPPQDLAIRAAADPARLIGPVREAVWAVDAEQPISQVRMLSEYYEADLAPRRFQMQLLGGFAALAALLASLGIYGMLAYTIAQRRREVGLRMALGAQPRDVTRLFVRQGLWPALAGIAIGVTVALGLSHVIAALLYGVPPRDPLTFTVAPAGLLIVALLACYVPSRRAVRVDPSVALRDE